MTFTFDARLGARGFHVALDVAAGETVAILGPNGAGKSTLLSLIAGLLSADDGRAELGDTVLFDSHGASVLLPPHARGVALLAQDALLFPHLSVLENVAFGPRSAGVPIRDAHAAARSWLAEVDALQLADRRAASLSGGEAQRVAIARALAARPALLLLDEPLAALDATQAPAVRATLRRVLTGRSAIIVTHDVLDAYSLADRVIVMEGGEIAQQGPTNRVLERPRTAFIAALAGLQVIRGIRTRTGLAAGDGIEIYADGGDDLEPGSRVACAVRPSAVEVSTSEGNNHANRIRAVVTSIEPRGDLVRVSSEVVCADVRPSVVASLGLEPGTVAWFSFAGSAATIYPD